MSQAKEQNHMAGKGQVLGGGYGDKHCCCHGIRQNLEYSTRSTRLSSLRYSGCSQMNRCPPKRVPRLTPAGLLRQCLHLVSSPLEDQLRMLGLPDF